MGSDKGKELHMQHGIKFALHSEYPAVWSKLHACPVTAIQLEVYQIYLAINVLCYFYEKCKQVK